MKEFFSALFALLVGALWMSGVFMTSDTAKLGHQAIEAIDQCESTLPRDQHCVLTAVREKSGE